MTPRPTFIIKKCPNVIILLHGFNSAPGKKSKQIQEFLKENNLKHEYELIIPKMSGEPRSAIREINKIIRSNKRYKGAFNWDLIGWVFMQIISEQSLKKTF